MDEVISNVASFIPFIIVISIVITVHELGHYWVGRLFGAAAESFSVGFGKPIFEVRDKRGTRWRVNWLPLGGFVKFVGEIQTPTDRREQPAGQSDQDATMIEDATRDGPTIKLVGKPYTELGPLQRLAVSLGGPFANFVFAVLVFGLLGLSFGIEKADRTMVASVTSGSSAEAAGFKVNDQLLTAGGRTVNTRLDVIQATSLRSGEAVRYTVLRDGAEMSLIATPRETVVSNEEFKVTEKVGQVGLGLEHDNLHNVRLNPIEAAGYGLSQTASALDSTVTVLRRLVTGKEGLDRLSGPLGIGSIADRGTDIQMKQDGVSLDKRLVGVALWLIQLSALLSIGVGFFNLLPIPVLDGGAAVMCIAEAVTGREVPEKVQRVGLTIGLACLVSFALVITWQDLTRLWPGGS